MQPRVRCPPRRDDDEHLVCYAPPFCERDIRSVKMFQHMRRDDSAKITVRPLAQVARVAERHHTWTGPHVAAPREVHVHVAPERRTEDSRAE